MLLRILRCKGTLRRSYSGNIRHRPEINLLHLVAEHQHSGAIRKCILFDRFQIRQTKRHIYITEHSAFCCFELRQRNGRTAHVIQRSDSEK